MGVNNIQWGGEFYPPTPGTLTFTLIDSDIDNQYPLTKNASIPQIQIRLPTTAHIRYRDFDIDHACRLYVLSIAHPLPNSNTCCLQ